MDGFAFALASALWLGILTAISPCPLATNIAAMSYIGRQVDSPRKVFLAGMLYAAGRTATYLALGILLVASLLSAPYISHLLLKYMNKLLGPILILVGMFLLELIRFNVSGLGVSERMQKRVEAWGIWGAALLGVVFALSFCPTSAALFFGSLVPLAVQYNSSILAPSVYGIGTALPVIVFATLIAFGARSVARAFDKITLVERWARRITGLIFIGIGIYFSLAFIFGVFS
jgi:cytochrome c-type biogenesis protein